MNCLNVTYKGVASDSAIPTPNQTKVEIVPATGDITLWLRFTEVCAVRLADGAKIKDSTATTATIPLSGKSIVLESAGTIIIDDTDKWMQLGVSNSFAWVNAKYLVDAKNLLTMDNLHVYGDMSGIHDFNTKVFRSNDVYLSGKSLVGDICVLGDMSNLTTIDIVRKGVFGELSSLGKLKNLTSVNLAENHICGSVESFVETQRLNGKTTGSITIFNVDNTDVTFDGSVSYGGASNALTWTANSITFWGKTVNV